MPCIRRRCTALIVLFIGCVHCASAQRLLRLDSAIAFAYRYSPKLQGAQLNVEEAQLARREAELTPYPALKYNFGASYAPAGRNFGYDVDVTNEGQLNGQLSVQGTIYNGGAYRLRKEQADLDIAHAQTGLALTREDLRFEVTQAFLEDLRSRESITIEQESVSELERYRDLVDRLFHGGTSGYTDLLKTEVQLGTEQIALEKSVADEIAARFSLASLMGTPLDTGFTVAGTFDSVFTEPAYRPESYDSLVTLTIALAQNELDRARLDIALARAQAKPSVDANIDAGLLTSLQNLTAPSGERNPFWGASAGISVTGPILDWGLNKTQVEEKEVIVQILESELLQQKRELAAQLTQLLVLLRTARARLADVRANLVKARDSYELEKAKYASGGALASEVLDAQRAVLDTRLSELDILNDIETYRSDLEHLTAAPEPSAGSNTNSNVNGK